MKIAINYKVGGANVLQGFNPVQQVVVDCSSFDDLAPYLDDLRKDNGPDCVSSFFQVPDCASAIKI